jgi:hypothetical protein
MPLRSFVAANPETINDMVLAADDRYDEAEHLLQQQAFDGAVYLMGYAAEMWLKVVCLRLRGLAPTTQVKPALAPLKVWARSLVVALLPKDGHDLSYFAQCIPPLRAAAGRPPLGPTISSELAVKITNGLYPEWIVDMRYRRSAVPATGAWDALNNAWWLKTNWTHLL